MTARERCKDCAYLVEGKHGEWVCSDYEIEIDKVSDDECWGDTQILDFIEVTKSWAIHDLGIEEYSDEWYQLMDI